MYRRGMHGASSGSLGVVESGRRLVELAPYFDSSSFRPLPISRSHGLDEGQDAYAAVADGTPGRIVATIPASCGTDGCRQQWHRSVGSRSWTQWDQTANEGRAE
jgi:hypothetical protein